MKRTLKIAAMVIACFFVLFTVGSFQLGKLEGYSKGYSKGVDTTIAIYDTTFNRQVKELDFYMDRTRKMIVELDSMKKAKHAEKLESFTNHSEIKK